MMTDIEIAQNAAMKPIYDIAKELGVSEEFVELLENIRRS